MGTAPKIDRRVVKTKEAITKAFLELFADKDLEQITINDIADRANVNRGTVYLHYSDKYDLLDKLIDDHLNRLIAFCDPSGDTPIVGELLPVFVYIRDHFRFFSAMLSTTRAAVFRSRLMKFVSFHVKDKLDRRNPQSLIDAELNAQFMASAFVGIVEWWIQHNMPHPPEFMADQLWKLFEKNEVYPRST
ncbi:TetR/AcrR family transcriptional regulator [Paenibacillus macerans]|uniref:TetR/AcrR family transcriptional regulator n=1 Tax=Paenibacillus macerans TaxID=44252 RepID=UPI00203F0D2A|nr:TetR/AcrR family transcriptional regulator [Paenibacillus macerans]MCM3697944.1 TetR/AcrR family transcriptional regulator [Paenibacillus macerans]